MAENHVLITWICDQVMNFGTVSGYLIQVLRLATLQANDLSD